MGFRFLDPIFPKIGTFQPPPALTETLKSLNQFEAPPQMTFPLPRLSLRRCLALLLAPLSVALAQAPEVVDGVRIFEPAYFTEFDPLTARDMVDRIPGVSPQQSDGGRGLAGVRSNLLINGERPPPKGKSAQEQLDEMPISSVVMIELIDQGARLDIDMQGYPQVINVITVENMPAYYRHRRYRTGESALIPARRHRVVFLGRSRIYRDGQDAGQQQSISFGIRCDRPGQSNATHFEP